MKKKEVAENKEINTENTRNKVVTTPILSNGLLSKVNSLTKNNPANINAVSYTDKNKVLDYKSVISELLKIMPVENLQDYFTKLYSIISKNIDCSFFLQ